MRRARPDPEARVPPSCERVGQAAARELDSGHDPERDAHSQRNSKREDEHAKIHARTKARQLRRREPQERGGRPLRQRQAGDRARTREDERFGQQLSDDPRPVRPDRAPEREIAPSRGAAAEQQARDVGAGDRKHECHCAAQHQQRPFDGSRKLLADRHQRRAAPVVFRMSPREPIADGRDLRTSLSEGHPGLQPGHRTQVARVAKAGHVGIFVGGGSRDVAWAAGYPELGAQVARCGARCDRRPRELTRHDGQHVPRPPIQHDGPAHDRWIGRKLAPPETLAQDDRRGIRAVRMEGLTQERPRSKDIEERRRDAGPGQAFRLAGPGQRKGHVADAGEAAEAGGLRPEVDHPTRPERLRVTARAGIPEKHQTIGLGKRQRLEQGRVDDAENRGVGADAKGQRQNRHEREPGRSTQSSDRVSNVLSDISPHGHTPLGRGERHLLRRCRRLPVGVSSMMNVS